MSVNVTVIEEVQDINIEILKQEVEINISVDQIATATAVQASIEAKEARDEAEISATNALISAQSALASEQSALESANLAEEYYIQTVRERRHDYVSPFSYIGNAPLNTLESDPVWTIYKILVNEDGSASKTKAENVAWTDRLTINYN
jgi:hypothetical protein